MRLEGLFPDSLSALHTSVTFGTWYVFSGSLLFIASVFSSAVLLPSFVIKSFFFSFVLSHKIFLAFLEVSSGEIMNSRGSFQTFGGS